MSETNSLIAWKTNAWQDPQMVAWYAQRMVDDSGTQPLKNRVERNIIDRYVLGKDLVDVGIGSGRASLPLLQRGFNITGIDSSQAMLDETRRQAGTAPIALHVGDVQRLPLGDGQFDCLVSLNVMVHFPHWQPVLTEWKRVLRPGGRIIFDIHSMDHLEASLPPDEAQRVAHAGEEHGGHGVYMSHVRAEEIARWADANGMRLAAIVPYSAYYGEPALNRWLQPLEHRFYWKRLLSWLGHDEHLLDFAVFLEESIVSRLTSAATCRYFAILDNVEDAGANALWREETAKMNTPLSEKEAVGHWENILPIKDGEWQKTLAWHLHRERNRQFLYLLLRTLRQRVPDFPWMHWVPQPFSGLFEDWSLQESIDSLTTTVCRNWTSATSAGQSLVCNGVQVAPGLEYTLMESLLTRLFGVFSGNRS